MTIHCITPNPAVDITYRVDDLAVHAVNRVREVTRRPGGKGVNVARLLAARGLPAATYGFLGGGTGNQLVDLLEALQPALPQRWTFTGADTRLTIAVVDGQDTTMFNEPGRPVTAGDWDGLAATVAEHCRPSDVVTISGSLPTGAEPERLADLVRAARDAGGTVIADTSGAGLIAAARAGAQLLKPNHHELLEATAAPDLATGIRQLLDAGSQAVVVSQGAEGILLGTPTATYHAGLGQQLTGNPTGAGDALVAALAAAIAAGPDAPLVDALPSAVGWSAAAVLSPVAGELDQATADQLTHDVTIKEL
ncbi:MAG: hexose kinase [Propionicimonas sp.]